MNKKNSLFKFLGYVLIFLIFVGVVGAVYYVSIPIKYDLTKGEASPYDINAARQVEDKRETSRRAELAKAEVKNIYIENHELSNRSLEKLELFFRLVDDGREQVHNLYFADIKNNEEAPEQGGNGNASDQEEVDTALPDYSEQATQVRDSVRSQVGESMELAIFETLLDPGFSNLQFESFSLNLQNTARSILSKRVDVEAINSSVYLKLWDNEDFKKFDLNVNLGIQILNKILKPNTYFDEKATNSAKQLAYDSVMAKPVIIEKGSRIVSYGEIVDEDIYNLLLELDLLETGKPDYYYLAGIIIYLSMLIIFIVFYIRKIEYEVLGASREKAALIIILTLTFVLSFFLVKVSVFAPPIYLATLLLAAYFGFRTSMMMSVFLTFAVLPLTAFDIRFLFVGLGTAFVTALFTSNIPKRNNYALIIISTTLTAFLGVIGIDVIFKHSPWETLWDAIYVLVSSSLSIIVALGIMPLFEIVFNTVSPIRLIELSQPGNPLLSRLFTEAPGTSQHCVMVGNLAEAAASAIGANPLIARVGAYYHDIGKLEEPGMFTENQSGYNPHDDLSPDESARIILSHPDAGLRLAKRYRLPKVIMKMIYEHHGTTKQAYFYHKAREESLKNGGEEPDPDNFKYGNAKPSFKESAILMLADTVEAAMKSTGTNTMDEAENLIRKLVKQKIQEDQLTDSNLSFKEIEEIIQAFLHVYSGHFKVRVRYPDADRDQQQARQS